MLSSVGCFVQVVLAGWCWGKQSSSGAQPVKRGPFLDFTGDDFSSPWFTGELSAHAAGLGACLSTNLGVQHLRGSRI